MMPIRRIMERVSVQARFMHPQIIICAARTLIWVRSVRPGSLSGRGVLSQPRAAGQHESWKVASPVSPMSEGEAHIPRPGPTAVQPVACAAARSISAGTASRSARER